jgi:hypothetical protein
MPVTFASVDKEVSNDLSYSGRSIVKSRGVGNDAYQTIDSVAGTTNKNARGSRALVRTSNGVLYSVSGQTTDDDVEVYKSLDDGETWTAQDTANEPTYSTGTEGKIACAIDSTDLIHIIWWENGTGLRYCTFNTSTDTYGTPETAYSETASQSSTTSVSITIDSNDIPHTAFIHTFSLKHLRYTNRIGGSWKTPIQEANASNMTGVDITINDDDIPQMSYIYNNSNLHVELGNQNDATSFSLYSGITAISTSVYNMTSIVVDKKGNTYVSYLDTGDDVHVVKHIKAKAWGTWETTVEVGTGTFTEGGTSLTINQAGDLYVFSIPTVTFDTTYWKSSNEGITWGSAQTDNHPSGTEQYIKSRWSFLNFHQPYKLDYSLNLSNSDIGFNTVLSECYSKWATIDRLVDTNSKNNKGARNLVRNSKGHLYFVGRDVSVNNVHIYKSDNESDSGLWTDFTGASNADTDAIAIAIDSTDIIHVVWWDQGTGLRYQTFNTSNDTFGSVQTAHSDTGTPTTPYVAITIDSNDIPHVAYDSGADELEYTNRIGGSWKTPVAVDTTADNNGYSGIDITIDDDDIVQLVASEDNTITDNIIAYIGNQNNATSFSNFNIVSATGISSHVSSIVIDKQGNTYVSYIASDLDVMVRKHLKGNAWSTWETSVEVVAGTYEDTSMTIDSQNNPVVISNNSSNVTFAYKSKDGGATWSAIDTSRDHSLLTDEHMRFRWSYLNYYFPTELDFGWTYDAGNDINYNKIRQTGKKLYVVGRDVGSSETQVMESPTNGNTWGELDSSNAEAGVDTDSVSCAIDELDDIHISWWDIGVGSRYIPFDMSTFSYGTVETAHSDTFTHTYYATSISIDYNNIPHMVWIRNSDDCEYSNRIGGTWKAPNTVETGTISHIEITMDNDNFPQIILLDSQSLFVKLGNQNDATGWNSYQIETTGVDSVRPDIAVDPKGDSYISFCKDDDPQFRKHTYGDSWFSWGSAVELEAGTYEDTSIALDKEGRIYVISNSSTNVTKVWVSTDGGATFGGGTTDNMPTVVDEHPRLRWSFYFYEDDGANLATMDYTVFDETANDVYYNRFTFLDSNPLDEVEDETENITEGSLRNLGLGRLANETENITETSPVGIVGKIRFAQTKKVLS